MKATRACPTMYQMSIFRLPQQALVSRVLRVQENACTDRLKLVHPASGLQRLHSYSNALLVTRGIRSDNVTRRPHRHVRSRLLHSHSKESCALWHLVVHLRYSIHGLRIESIDQCNVDRHLVCDPHADGVRGVQVETRV